jgi:hypothetical protein
MNFDCKIGITILKYDWVVGYLVITKWMVTK